MRSLLATHRTALLLLLAATSATTSPTPIAAQDLFLRNARIVDPVSRTVRPGNVLIIGGAVANFPDEPPEGFSGEVLDVAERWVMPALADMHTHSFGNAGAAGMPQMLGPTGVVRVALEAGVGRVLDLFSAEDFVLGVREEQRNGKHPGAELLAAGPCLTATNGHCAEYGIPTRIVNTPEDAVREVNDLARKHPDVVKVVYDHATYSGRSLPTIDRATLEAVVQTATANGIKTVVHIGTWDDVRDAVNVGASAVTHTPGPAPIPDDLPALMLARGTVHIPTLAVQGDFSRFVDDPSLLDSKLLARIAPPALIDGYRQPPDSTSPMAGFVSWQRTLRASNMASVGVLHRAGVPMLTGTDGGNPGVFQGYSVHRELQLLVEAGLSPWDAIAATTVTAGRFLKASWGLTTGAEGTLLVLDASPVDDIRNTEAIAAVIQRGRVVFNAMAQPQDVRGASSTATALASWIALAAPPGAETEVGEALQSALPGWTVDRWGNLVRHVGSGAPRRVVACALDQSAYVVSQITNDGYLRLRRTGAAGHSLWDQFHEAQRVQLFTSGGRRPGVIAVPNGHFARQHRADTVALTFNELWVDVGAQSAAEVTSLGIALLDPVMIDRPAWAFAGLAAGPGAGARTGCAAVAAAAASAAADGVTSGETTFVLSTQSIFGWVGLSTVLVGLPNIDALAIVNSGEDARAVVGTSADQLPRDLRALTGRVTADSVHIYAPMVRFGGSLVETVSDLEADALLAWVVQRAALRSTAAFAALPETGVIRVPAATDQYDALAREFMELADLPGVPGHEWRVRDAILAALPAWARDVATVDTAGNLIVAMGPDREAVAFLAHMDEVAFEVDRILPDGQVTLRRLGGVVLPSWEGVPALLHFDPTGAGPVAESLRGVFVPRAAGRTKTPPDLTAWFGMDSAQLVARGVRPGLGITAYKQATRLAGTRVTARASDDRTGSVTLIHALRAIDPAALTHRVYFVWTVREESGLLGARAFGNSVGASLRYVYSVDTFVASDTPLESRHFAYTPLGAGPVLRGLDDSNLVSRTDRERIIGLARTAGVPLQVGTTQGGTDGGAVSPWGPPNIGLSWPGRYSHGPAEVLDLKDVSALIRLVTVVATAP